MYIPVEKFGPTNVWRFVELLQRGQFVTRRILKKIELINHRYTCSKWVTNSLSQTSRAPNYCVACLSVCSPVVHPLLAFRRHSFRFIALSDVTFLCFIIFSTSSSLFTAVRPRRLLPSSDQVVIR
jgi:hypothetical protein